MALSSMTGFARADGVSGSYHLELGAQIRQRQGTGAAPAPAAGLGCGRDSGAPARDRGAGARHRLRQLVGHARRASPPVVRVNESVLAAVLDTIGDVAHRVDAAPPRLDGILALKGVIEVSEPDEREEDRARRRGGGDRPASPRRSQAWREMRRHEGAALRRVLAARLDEIAALCGARRGRARPAPGSDQGAARRTGRRCCSTPPSGSMPTGCTRKRS